MQSQRSGSPVPRSTSPLVRDPRKRPRELEREKERKREREREESEAEEGEEKRRRLSHEEKESDIIEETEVCVYFTRAIMYVLISNVWCRCDCL